MSRMQIIIAFVACFFITSCYVPPQLWTSYPEQRNTLPEWHTPAPIPYQVLKQGELKKVKVNPKASIEKYDSDSHSTKVKTIDTGLPKYYAARIFVTKNQPVEIEIKSKKGYPVILLYDRYLHPYDITPFLDQEIKEQELFNFNAIKYVTGNKKKASLAFNPSINGIYEMRTWVIRGKVKVSESYNPSEEETEAMDTMFTPEMIAWMKMSNPPEIVSAWYGDSKEIENGEFKKLSWKRSKMRIAVHEKQNVSETTSQLFYHELMNQDTSAMNIPVETKTWIEACKENVLAQSKGIEKALVWNKSDYNPAPDSILKFQLELLKNWQINPYLQGYLKKRCDFRQEWSDQNAANEYIEIEQSYKGGESYLVSNSITKSLGIMLGYLGGIDAVVVDTGGYIMGSVNPFILTRLSDEKSWQVIKNNASTQFTEPYKISGYNFMMRKIAFPIRYFEDQQLIGWIITEVYAGKSEIE